jgi:hypothetical protein
MRILFNFLIALLVVIGWDVIKLAFHDFQRAAGLKDRTVHEALHKCPVCGARCYDYMEIRKL